MLTLAFYPVDTWFFRESRPMESQGGTSLGNQFPPPPSTLMGALRTRIGDMFGVNWQDISALPSWWGDSDHWGDLNLEGPWIRVEQEDYYPCPAHLLHSNNGETTSYATLAPGDIVHCDLGRVRLPVLPAGTPLGCKPFEEHWLPRADFSALLGNKAPSGNLRLLSTDAMLANEYRLGIGIDANKRAVIEGQIYQTRHLRPRQELAVLVNLHGMPADQEEKFKQEILRQPLLRLGGEGRMAEVRPVSSPKDMSQGTPPSKAKLLAVTLAPMPVTGEQWPLPGFVKHRIQGQDCWQGELNGYPLTLLTMVSGKIRRQGGWDLKLHQPRPVQNQLPAGTVFYFDDAPLPPESRYMTINIVGQRIPLALGWWQDNQTNFIKE